MESYGHAADFAPAQAAGQWRMRPLVAGRGDGTGQSQGLGDLAPPINSLSGGALVTAGVGCNGGVTAM